MAQATKNLEQTQRSSADPMSWNPPLESPGFARVPSASLWSRDMGIQRIEFLPRRKKTERNRWFLSMLLGDKDPERHFHSG